MDMSGYPTQQAAGHMPSPLSQQQYEQARQHQYMLHQHQQHMQSQQMQQTMGPPSAANPMASGHVPISQASPLMMHPQQSPLQQQQQQNSSPPTSMASHAAMAHHQQQQQQQRQSGLNPNSPHGLVQARQAMHSSSPQHMLYQQQMRQTPPIPAQQAQAQDAQPFHPGQMRQFVQVARPGSAQGYYAPPPPPKAAPPQGPYPPPQQQQQQQQYWQKAPMPQQQQPIMRPIQQLPAQQQQSVRYYIQPSGDGSPQDMARPVQIIPQPPPQQQQYGQPQYDAQMYQHPSGVPTTLRQALAADAGPMGMPPHQLAPSPAQQAVDTLAPPPAQQPKARSPSKKPATKHSPMPPASEHGARGERLLLDREGLDALAKSVDAHAALDDEVSDSTLQLLDSFIDDLIGGSVEVSHHRGSKRLEAKDVHYMLERRLGLLIPPTSNGHVGWAAAGGVVAPPPAKRPTPAAQAHHNRQAHIAKK